MTYDAHTPCPACPMQVRHLYECSVVLALLLEQSALPEDVGRRLAEPLASVKLATEMLRPYVEGHLANQLHAWSAELIDARAPSRPAEQLSDEQLRLLPLDARD